MTDLPKSDDVLERHQFYAALRSDMNTTIVDVNRQHDTIHRIHLRLDKTDGKYQEVNTELGKTEIRNKTIASVVIVIWMGISGITTWMWDKSTAKIESYITKIEAQEKVIDGLKRNQETLLAEIQTLAATKRILAGIQQDVDRLSAEVLKK